ncbi:DUF4397 domain-containing protein [Chitinophaga qingshengii]|uniref:DUF4397 domain-containing protein n=1 Tax=Chitinophaga qingshengii TaxID=1569794 RepID=A0ABR7TFE0_9BACT|nr:DUF4397 domain-containing protein [Chitinophaga qingshengii]MBC9929047.1 DUF4397 domain-containing protein [Chitinophaga qingshengii]
MKRYFPFILLAFSACTKSDYLDVNAGERPPLQAYISFVNARPVATGIQFWTFTQQVTTTAVGANQSSPYLPATYGNVQINFTEGNGSSYKASRQFGNSAAYTENGGPNGPIPGYYHTVVAAAKKDDRSKDTLVLFYDDLSKAPDGKAKLRFLHFAAGIGDVQVTLQQQGSGKVWFEKVSYGSAGGGNLSGAAYDLGPFTNVNAGTISLTVSVNGKPLDIPALASLKLEAGKAYTVLLNSSVNEKGVPGASLLVHE